MIITISRGSFSGGSVVAECVAQQLDYKLVSREILATAAARYGIAEQRLAEALDRAPGLWERLGHERRLYLVFIQSALLDLVEKDSVVYHGHAGHLLLRGISHVLRVRLIAPSVFRMNAAMDRLHCTREAAEAHIQRVDKERARWTRFLYGIDWLDPVLYDITLNLEKFSIEAACDVVVGVMKRPEFEVTEENRRELADLELASHTHARLFLNPKVAAAATKIDVKAKDGVVHLSGILPGDALLDDVLETCRNLPEVKDVRAEWLGAREDRF